AGGSYNVNNSVYIGGGTPTAGSPGQIDLSGAQNAVDSTSLGLANTSVGGGGTELTGGTANAIRPDAPGAPLLTAAHPTETFTFNLIANGSASTFAATVTGAAGGITAQQVLSQLNGQLNGYGINAQIGSDGQLQFGGGTPFTVSTSLA